MNTSSHSGHSPRKRLSPNWTADAIAGFANALVCIPDALASSILAGVSPTSGLYALMVGTPLASTFASAEFMIASATTAIAIATGGIMADISPEQRSTALVVLTMMAGMVQLLLGIFKQGSIVRFVSNAVMTGFLAGIATSIVLGQLGDLTGYASQAGNKITKALDLLLHFNQVNFPTTLIGLGTIALVLLFERTRLKTYAMVMALVIATAIVWFWQPPSVALIKTIADIPRSLPMPVLPDLSLIPRLFPGAVAVALLGLIQGAGITKTVPNANGRYGDVSKDFSAQGIANLVSGCFRGIPIGSSLAGTAFNLGMGAKSRWAGIFTGLFVMIMVLLFAGGVEQIPIPAIAALLVLAGMQLLLSKVEGMIDVWQTGWVPGLIMLVTFVATLLLPVQNAVLLGVVLSIIAYVYRSSLDGRVVQIVFTADGRSLQEQSAPESVPSNAITILNIYGSVFYASAEVIRQLFPDPATANRSVVILGLRGRSELGSTFLKVLERYANELQAHNSQLMLMGVTPDVLQQLVKTGMIASLGESNIFLETDILGESLSRSHKAAQSWLEDTQVS